MPELQGDKPSIVFVYWYGQVPKCLRDWPCHEVVEIHNNEVEELNA